MLAEQYRDFMEATTGALLPSVTAHTTPRCELRRSTAATAAKVKEMSTTGAMHATTGTQSDRRAAMLEALAGLNDQPSQAPMHEYELPAMDPSAALQMCSAAVLTSMAYAKVVSGRTRRSSQLLQDAVRLSSGSNFLLQRALAASSAKNLEEAHSISFRSAVQAGRQYFDTTLPPVPCW
eukprot:s3060_g6.t1